MRSQLHGITVVTRDINSLSDSSEQHVMFVGAKSASPCGDSVCLWLHPCPSCPKGSIKSSRSEYHTYISTLSLSEKFESGQGHIPKDVFLLLLPQKF